MNLNFRKALIKNSTAIEAEGSAPVDASPVDADASYSNRDQDTGYSSDHLAKLRKQHLEAAREAARIKKAEEDEAVERELDAAIARSRREHDAMEAAANANAKDDQDALIVEAIRGGGEVEVIDLAGSSSSDDGDKKLSAKEAKKAKKASPKRKGRQKRPIRALDANEEVIEIDNMPTDPPCAPFAAAAASSTTSNAPRAPRGDEDFARRLQEEEDAALSARINPHGEVLDKLFSSKSSEVNATTTTTSSSTVAVSAAAASSSAAVSSSNNVEEAKRVATEYAKSKSGWTTKMRKGYIEAVGIAANIANPIDIERYVKDILKLRHKNPNVTRRHKVLEKKRDS